METRIMKSLFAWREARRRSGGRPMLQVAAAVAVAVAVAVLCCCCCSYLPLCEAGFVEGDVGLSGQGVPAAFGDFDSDKRYICACMCICMYVNVCVCVLR